MDFCERVGSSSGLGFLPPVNLLINASSDGRVSFRERGGDKPRSLFFLCDCFDQSEQIVDCLILCLDMNDEP